MLCNDSKSFEEEKINEMLLHKDFIRRFKGIV